MEPITHLLTGACLARTGFNRKTAYATLAMTLAAEAPDLDFLWSLRGPAAGLQHHRGLTHTLLGAPLVALAVTAAVWLLVWISDRSLLRGRRKRRFSPPARWILIWLFAWIAVLSHIFLDWANNYGVRPFFPFNPRWYSLDLVYIFEPVLFALLLLALVIPAILGMADREIGARPTAFRGRGWAIAALILACALWGLRWGEHRNALRLARNTRFGNEPAIRIAAEPYPINPFHWFVVVETADYYQTGSVDTWRDEVATGENDVVFKPPVTAAVAAAKDSRLGRAYLDWAALPVVADLGPADLTAAGSQAPNPKDSVVEFRDLRFAYSTPLTEILGSGGGEPPLAARVFVTPDNTIDGIEMNGRVRKASDWR